MSARTRGLLALSVSLNLVLLLGLWWTLSNPAAPNNREQTAALSLSSTATRVAAATSTVTPTPTASATTTPTLLPAIASPTPSPTPSPTASPPPSPTPTLPPTPSPSPEPTMTATAEAEPAAAWLAYLNQFRHQAGLPLLVEDLALTTGSAWHSGYMAQTDNPIAHYEDPAHLLFRTHGDHAARHGNIFATSVSDGTGDWAINFWVSAPFHAVPLFDPQLQSVGFGQYAEPDGDVQMAAVLDVLSGVRPDLTDVTYPVMFPRDGGQTWVVRFSLYEWPEPLQSCPGYQQPTGPALILQLGPGDQTPHLTGYTLRIGDRVLDVCAFDETSYVNPDPYQQEVGRLILDERDAIILIPRQPLEVGQQYTASVAVNGRLYTWRFNAVNRPAEP